MVVLIKHHNQKQVWKERVYLTYTSASFLSSKEVKAGTQTGTQGRELVQRS